MSELRTGSLFSGYGGLELAVNEVYGATTAWVSDIDKGACKILAHRYPEVPNLGDITTVDWSQVEPVDILTGGSPCQDLSHAGRRAGMTDGTRSNLWVAMREAIAQLRPAMVVWENVGGAFSAAADSEVEPCAGCVGDGTGVHLRALGRVLGDLSSLGYDTSWHALRAADVGAPHGRLRVFVVATDAQRGGRDGRSPEPLGSQVGRAAAAGSGEGVGTTTDASGLRRGERRPTEPREADGGRALCDTAGRGLLPAPRATRGGSATETVGLLPTPRATDGTKGGPNQRGSSGDLMLPSAVAMLPTPAARDWKGFGPADGDRHDPNLSAISLLLPTPRVTQAGYADDGSGGRSLDVEARRLLPTPTAAVAVASGGSSPSDVTLTDAVVRTDLGTTSNPRHEESHAVPAEEGPREELSSLREAADPQAVCERSARGSDCLPEAGSLLASVREHEACGDEGCVALAGEKAQGRCLPRLWDDDQAARSPRGPQPGEQRPVESDDALRELSPEAALAGGSNGIDWGPYTAAIRRWEGVLGRPAPPPTVPSKKGNPQLCPEFVTWLMGLPAGWVTDVPGITRNEALKALGNGVVPAQAAEALRVMAAWEVAA